MTSINHGQSEDIDIVFGQVRALMVAVSALVKTHENVSDLAACFDKLQRTEENQLKLQTASAAAVMGFGEVVEQLHHVLNRAVVVQQNENSR
jgi:hypothetical protein